MTIPSRPCFIAMLLGLASLVFTACSSGPSPWDNYEGTRWEKINACNQMPEGQREVCVEHVESQHEREQKREKSQNNS